MKITRDTVRQSGFYELGGSNDDAIVAGDKLELCVSVHPITIYPLAIVQFGAEIGSGSKIESFCFVERGAVIGARVTIKPGVYVWRGVEISDDVFIGPGVRFCNDPWPRVGKPCPVTPTFVGHGASIGAGAILLPGAWIPPHSMVAAGAVVRAEHPEDRGMLFTRGRGPVPNDKIDLDRLNCTRCFPDEAATMARG
jgi:UDP-2-acetamido-3-amino-2,3-dideoxy-glucuronate N-acetyltransferase